MADLTTASTQSQSVQGNRRVVLVEVGATAGTTSDTVRIHYLSNVLGMYGAQFTSTSTAQLNTSPQLFQGSTINLVQIVRSSLTTGSAFRFYAEGY